MIEKHINERVRNILVNDFKIKPDVIDILEAGEEYHAEEAIYNDLPPYKIIQNINNSFDHYDQMNEKEREYLKFIIAFKISGRIELNKQVPFNKRWKDDEFLDNLELSFKCLYNFKQIMLNFRKTMPYYIKQFDRGEIDKSKFRDKLLPESIAKGLYETKMDIEKELGDEFDIGL